MNKFIYSTILIFTLISYHLIIKLVFEGSDQITKKGKG